MKLERKVTHQNAASASATGAVMNCAGLVGALVQITGTFVASVAFQATVDGSTWVAVPATNVNSNAVATTATAAGLYWIPFAGARLFRCNMTWTSGTSITATGIGVGDAAGQNSAVASTVPFSAILEGGITELVGTDEEVNTNDYGGSVGVALGGTYSGEILSFGFFATEDGTGAVQDSAGQLIILDADPAVSAGDTAITAAEHLTILAKVAVVATDWHTDANGGFAYIFDTPVPFHALSTLYFVWFHEDATDLNDGAGDDEQLEMNFWWRRES
jgi:hypothetical protein